MPKDDIDTFREIAVTRNRREVIEVTMQENSLFEAWSLPINFRVEGGRTTNGEGTLYFDLFRHALILRNRPLIEYHGFSRDTVASNLRSTVISHAQTWWNQRSGFRDREVIDVSGGDDQTGTGIGFCKLPTVSNGMITFCLTTPPSRSRLRSDHLQYSNIKADKQPEGPRQLLSFLESYNTDHTVNEPAHTGDSYLIRRYIAYNDESFIASKWFRLNNLTNSFEPANDVLDNKDTTFTSSDLGDSVYDFVNLLTPEINVGRCV